MYWKNIFVNFIDLAHVIIKQKPKASLSPFERTTVSSQKVNLHICFFLTYSPFSTDTILSKQWECPGLVPFTNILWAMKWKKTLVAALCGVLNASRSLLITPGSRSQGRLWTSGCVCVDSHLSPPRGRQLNSVFSSSPSLFLWGIFYMKMLSLFGPHSFLCSARDA